jgi:3',5'-cyclic AMP phosphodiesterase CpdA
MPKTLRRYLAYAVTVIAGVSASSHGPRAAQPDTTASLRFAAIGDSGTGEKAQYEVAAVMAATRSRLPFELVVMLGDNVYGGWSRTAAVERFERPYRPLLDAGVRFYASLGNHDEADERSYAPFHMGGQRYYTFTRSNVDFFALDSNYMDRPQLLWLEQHLQASRARWKLAFFHHPLYSSAERHGSEKDLRRLLEPLLIQYGVQVVLSGHDHVYERINPQHGITYFVCGSSGELRRGNLERGSGLTAAGFDQDRTFMVMEAAADTLSFQAISRTSTVVDSGQINWTAHVSRLKGADLNHHEAGLVP